MSRGKVILIGGGVRSGKSDFALATARRLGNRRLFLATAQAGDSEMRERIDRHRQSRGDDFHTVEEPLAVTEILKRHAGDYDAVVLDCLTLWLSNLLLRGDDAGAVARRVEDLAHVLARKRVNVVVVSNEVGLGLVPESPLGRVFRDVAGLAHQRLAAIADEVYFGVMGLLLRIKPGPIVPAGEVQP